MAEQPNDPRVELERIVKELECRRIAERCGQRVIAHDHGPMFWLRECTKTENYHWEAQGRQPKEPFPYKPHGFDDWRGLNPLEHPEFDYLDHLMGALLKSYADRKPIYIPKTREMLTSWLVVGYITWACQFFPNIEAVGQSEKDDKAQGLIKYANILYDNQDGWLKQRHPLKRGDTGTAHRIEWANGSSLTGIPQGERQTASKHPTIYFNDESAHQPAWEATINVVKPVAKQIICVSSAAASRFGDLCAPPVQAPTI